MPAGGEARPHAPYVPRRVPDRGEIAVRGGRLAVTRWESGARQTPVLLLHGWMDCGESFQFLADCLPDDWSLAALDWRGYGRSEPRAGYWLPDYLADLEAALEQLSPREPARLIGHSLGGILASLYAGVRPQRLAWVVNIEGFGLWRGSSLAVAERIASWLDAERAPPAAPRYASLEQLSARICERNPHLPPERAQFLARLWSRPEGRGYRLAADPRHRLISPLRYRNDDLHACWERVTCPVLMLYGEASQLLARIGADRALGPWRERFGARSIAAVPDAGHMVHLEQPERTAGHIVRFAHAGTSPGA